MKAIPVLFAPEAQDDLDSLFAYVADHSGRVAALRFIGSLTDYCLKLGFAPQRGMLRDDLAPGLRLLGYRRRATIAFLIGEDGVVILRVLYRGRDIEALLKSEGEEEPE